FLNCGPAEAVRIGLAAAGGKNLEVFSPTIGRQLLELGLIDEIDLHIVPVLLGQGIRLYDNPGGKPVRLHRVGDGDPLSAVNVRYRPASGLWTGPGSSMFTASTCAWMLLATRPTRRSCSSAAWAPRWTGGRTNSARGWPAGRFVIRYDHRDTGRSVSYPAGAPGYTGADLAADAAGVLDAFGRRSAHLAGVSMGGALAQQVALAHPDRVDSLVLMSTSPAVPSRRELPPMSDELRAWFAAEVPLPDWAERSAVIDYLVGYERQ